jgi:nitrite reductase/ring-hydroxylating ferredoxin subunit
MNAPNKEFALAGSLEELKTKGRLVVRGGHRPILVIYDRGRVFALDNRCPHMGFPLERGSVEDGILTCHWHHARFDLESGCTFNLWADDVPIFPVENSNGLAEIAVNQGRAGRELNLAIGTTSRLSLECAARLPARVQPTGTTRRQTRFGGRRGISHAQAISPARARSPAFPRPWSLHPVD